MTARTRKQWEEYLNGGNKNRAAVPVADLEPHPRHESVGEKKPPRLDSRCSIHMHSRRHALADADGLSGKAVIDGLIHAGILQNDSPAEVSQVTYSQEKIGRKEEEQTIITIRWEG